MAKNRDTNIQWGTIDVTTFGWEKICRSLEKLDTLVEIGLADRLIAFSGVDPGGIRTVCASVEDVDLSKNLFSSWQKVAEICCEMPNLRILRLSYCRMEIQPMLQPNAFETVRILTLGQANLDWNQVEQFVPWFKNLDELHLGFNNITTLNEPVGWPSLSVLNLEHNRIDNWKQVLYLGQIGSLQVLNLNNNQITRIEKPTEEQFKRLRFINLNNNVISTWLDVDQLNYFENLVEIRVSHVPVVVNLPPKEKHALMIARLGKAVKLNGSSISKRERRDSELYYLSRCAQVTQEPNFAQDHPRFPVLCEIYGTPSTSNVSTAMKDNLIPVVMKSASKQAIKKLSPMLTLRAVKAATARTLFPNQWQKALDAQLLWSHDGQLEPLDDPLKDLSTYGIHPGDELLLDFQ